MGDVQKRVTRNSERKKERKKKEKERKKTYQELCYARDLMKIYIARKFHENVIKGFSN